MQVIDFQKEEQEETRKNCDLEQLKERIASLSDSEFVIFIPIGGMER